MSSFVLRLRIKEDTERQTRLKDSILTIESYHNTVREGLYVVGRKNSKIKLNKMDFI